MIKTTKTTIEHEDLPKDGIVCLNDVKEVVENEKLEETINLALKNGYLLSDINDHEIYGTEYVLVKYEVEK